jgi:hypothetical protein
MAYRPDFYTEVNIVGYTGDLRNYPTVYFISDSGEYGHITQDHSQRDNIGRERVSNSDHYVMSNAPLFPTGNRTKVHQLQEVERDANRHITMRHTSRNEFTTVYRHPAHDPDRAILATAIINHPNLKERYQPTPSCIIF